MKMAHRYKTTCCTCYRTILRTEWYKEIPNSKLTQCITCVKNNIVYHRPIKISDNDGTTHLVRDPIRSELEDLYGVK